MVLGMVKPAAATSRLVSSKLLQVFPRRQQILPASKLIQFGWAMTKAQEGQDSLVTLKALRVDFCFEGLVPMVVGPKS